MEAGARGQLTVYVLQIRHEDAVTDPDVRVSLAIAQRLAGISSSWEYTGDRYEAESGGGLYTIYVCPVHDI